MYNSDQKQIINSLKKVQTPDKETSYLFFVNNVASKGDATGYMPMQYQYGFIYDYRTARAVAHELGHGEFNLPHTFAKPFIKEQGSTDNLMDYSAGTELWKHQWKLIQNPSSMLFKFLQDEGGAEYKFGAANQYIGFSPDGRIISIKEGYRTIILSKDSRYLQGFITKENKIYQWNSNKNDYFLWDSINNVYNENDKFLSGSWSTASSVSGDVAVWRYTNESDCYRLYKYISVTNYTVAKFNELQDPINNTSGNWNAEYNIADLPNTQKADCEKLAQAAIDSLAIRGTGGENKQIINHSGLSVETLLKYITQTQTDLNISPKVYILDASASDYDKWKKEAEADVEANKFIFTINNQSLQMDYHLQAPDWFKELFKNVNVDDCIIEYVNQALTELHKNSVYQKDAVVDKVLKEYLVVIYREFFGMLYCATDENHVANMPAEGKFVAGAIHELVGIIDVASIIEGLIQLVSSGISTTIDSYQSFFSDIRQTCKDVSNGTPISTADLIKRMIPPSTRSDMKVIQAMQAIGSHMVYLYDKDCGETDPKKQTGLCPYRYGQVVGIALPIVFTGGEWLISKSGSWATRLSSVFGRKADDVAKLIAEAENAGYTIAKQEGKLIIQNGDEVTTIAKAGDELVISVAKGEIVTHIVEADFNVLKSATTVARANGERAINNVTTLVNNKQALVIKPIENSFLASKMNDYINALKNGNTARQGEIGEEMAEMLAKEIDKTTVLNIKLNNSGNGFDVMQFENGLENTTKIRLFESKPMNNNSVVLPKTATKGTQMGNDWIDATIQEMRSSQDNNVANIGNILRQNRNQIERYVFTVDKDLEQIIIFKLDNFQ